jgi:hypothetical protein
VQRDDTGRRHGAEASDRNEELNVVTDRSARRELDDALQPSGLTLPETFPAPSHCSSLQDTD